MSEDLTHQTSTSKAPMEFATKDTHPVRGIHMDMENLHKALVDLLSEFKNFNVKWNAEDKVRKTDAECEELRKKPDDADLRDDIRSLCPKVECDMNDVETKTCNTPSSLCKIDQHNKSTVRLTIDRLKSPSSESDISETTEWSSLLEIIAPVPIFDGYNITVSRFINSCRHVQRQVSRQEEADVVRLLKNKLYGKAYMALYWRKFTNITQLIDKLKFLFMHSWQYYQKLDRLFLRRREDILDYIDRAQDLYDDIIEAERIENEPLTNSAISEIDHRFSTSFFRGLPVRIRQQMMRNENKPSEKPYEVFEAAIKATRQLEKMCHANGLDRDYSYRYEAPYEVPYYETDAERMHEAPRDRPRKNNRGDRQNSCNRRESGGRSNRTATMRNQRNSKWCRYCKNLGHKIEQCRKREYNNARNNFSGELVKPLETVERVSDEAKHLTSDECNRNSEQRIVITTCSRSGSRIDSNISHRPTVTISASGLLPEIDFIISTGNPISIVKARGVHPKTPIFREDIPDIIDITRNYVEILGSIQISFMGHRVKLYDIPNNIEIPFEGILGNDFLMDVHISALTHMDT